MAATFAAAPQPHNYSRIAKFFGEGATYDVIEGRFRKIKAEAARLREELDDRGGEEGHIPAAASPAARTAPRQKKRGAGASGSQGVLEGRVTKASTAPVSRKKTKKEGTADGVRKSWTDRDSAGPNSNGDSSGDVLRNSQGSGPRSSQASSGRTPSAATSMTAGAQLGDDLYLTELYGVHDAMEDFDDFIVA
ncbi:MAG: hypothetical protein M1825_005553 [Sarcosagium campestre]|nr:MAG: hypothetical protein M1825_005553 [Sarcosagium campestre]